jgi:membrane associated rhomboid family serine protease
MGIYDREYYRGDGPSFLGSFADRARTCKWLIGINVVLFLLQAVAQPRNRVQYERDENGEIVAVQPVPQVNKFTDALELKADKVVQGQVWRLLSYAFLHDPSSIWHLVFNMLALWWFGADVEDLYGPKEFLAVYLVSAVLGGIAFTLAWLAHLSSSPNCLGASGAVIAVMVLCAIHYPTRTILLFWFVPVQIWLLVVLYVAYDAFQFVSQAETQTAVTVHLAGAGFAFLYYKANWRLVPMWNSVLAWPRQLLRPKLRIYREEPRQPVSVSAPSAGNVDEQLEAKLDAVLEKVARHGKQSLTETENQILMRASEIYKRRRS